MPNFDRVDLNLFRLFEALYEERSVSRAAERLFITPSAVSHSLRRIRTMMGDELFLRGPRGMQPTPRAHAIAAQLRILLPKLAEVIAPPDFDPAQTSRVFAIACVPYLATVLMPQLAADVAQHAPQARIDLRLIYGTLVDDLDSGALDLALGHFRRTPPRFVTEEILRDSYVWVMRREHPDAGRPLTIEMLSSLPHIDLHIDNQAKNMVESFDVRQGLERLVVQNGIASLEEALLGEGLRRRVRAQAPDSLAGMALVARSEGVCLVPESVAKRFAETFDLVLRDPPYASAPLVIQSLIHADYREKPALRWLLDRIRSAAANMAERTG